MATVKLALQILAEEGFRGLCVRAANKIRKRALLAAFRIGRRTGLSRSDRTPVPIIASSFCPDEIAVFERLWRMSDRFGASVLLPDYLHRPLSDLAHYGGQSSLQTISYTQAERRVDANDFNTIVLQRGCLQRLPIDEVKRILGQWKCVFGFGEIAILTSCAAAEADPDAAQSLALLQHAVAELAELEANDLLCTTPFGAKLRCHYSLTDVGIIREVAEEYLDWANVCPAADDVIVDIGANIGTFSVACGMRNSAGTVFAFEPCRDNFELLLENVERNCPNKVQAFLKAVHRDSSPRQLYLDPENPGGHTLFEKRWASSAAATECIDLASILQLVGGHIDILKVDAEGSEYDILFPSGELIRRHVGKVVMEAHRHGNRNGDDLVRFFNDLGFEVRTKGATNLMLLVAESPTNAGRETDPQQRAA